jgi:hypothetical protein
MKNVLSLATFRKLFGRMAPIILAMLAEAAQRALQDSTPEPKSRKPSLADGATSETPRPVD